MAYHIDRIQKYTPVKGVFFFDTMIWLHVISPNINPRSGRLIRYASFFDKVYKEPSAKIAISSTLVSEIVNRYMRDIALESYKSLGHTVHSNEFKTKYRPTQHYQDQYDIVCDEISSRSDSFIFLNENLSELDFHDISSKSHLDFNDYCTYHLCKKESLSIVTDDEDFFVEDVQVYTLNDRLYNKQF